MTRLPTEADHSLDITTVSRRPSTAAITAMAEMIPVTGTCPLRKPSSAGGRSTWGSSERSALMMGSPVTAAGRSMALKRSLQVSTMNRALAGNRRRTASTVTIESIPPPKGIRGRVVAGL